MEPSAPADFVRPSGARPADGRDSDRGRTLSSTSPKPSVTIGVLPARVTMSQLERIYKLDRLLRRKSPPTKREILAEFEISPAQFKRDLDFMRERLEATITFDSTTGGYRYSCEIGRAHV